MTSYRQSTSVESDLVARLEAVDRIRAEGGGRLPPAALVAAGELSDRAAARLRHGTDATVVALAGATGSGKSTLFNALVSPEGKEVAETGVRRPTTSETTAATFGPHRTDGLLEWLEVRQRHTVDKPGPLDGLVLLDLPDHDSVVTSHQLEVDRLVAVVDLLVWVLDPQKYADEVLHDRFLRRLSEHAAVMVFVLNQTDLVAAGERERWQNDARRLLEADGLSDVCIVMTSATTGDGLPQLVDVMTDRIAERTTAIARIDADLRTLAAHLGAVPRPPVVSASADRDLAHRLARAAGAATVGASVAAGYRHDATLATGWPFLRWTRRLRRHPLLALRSGRAPSERETTTGGDGESVPAARPGAIAVDRAGLDLALRDYADLRAGDAPSEWRRAVRRAATSQRDRLPAALGRNVLQVAAGPVRPPHWWRAVGSVQWLLAVTVLAGLAWLGVVSVMGYLKVPTDALLPEVWGWPVPTAMVAGGVVAGLLIGGLARFPAHIGARRRGLKAAAAIETEITSTARAFVINPVRSELDTWNELESSIDRIAGRSYTPGPHN